MPKLDRGCSTATFTQGLTIGAPGLGPPPWALGAAPFPASLSSLPCCLLQAGMASALLGRVAVRALRPARLVVGCLRQVHGGQPLSSLRAAVAASIIASQLAPRRPQQQQQQPRQRPAAAAAAAGAATDAAPAAAPAGQVRAGAGWLALHAPSCLPAARPAAGRRAPPLPVCTHPLLPQDRKAGSGRIGEAGGRGLVDVNPPRGTRDFFPEVRCLCMAASHRMVAGRAWRCTALGRSPLRGAPSQRQKPPPTARVPHPPAGQAAAELAVCGVGGGQRGLRL